MAKAITNIEKHIPDQAEKEAQAVRHIVQAAAGSPEPLVKLLDILQELDRLGVLDAIQGILKNSEQIASIGIHQLNKPGAHRIIKNAIGAVQFLSRLDPDKLQTIFHGLSAGVEYAADDSPTKKQDYGDHQNIARTRSRRIAIHDDEIFAGDGQRAEGISVTVMNGVQQT